MSSTLVTVLYLCFLLVATAYTYYKPRYNWDMLPYMALVASAEGANSKQAHEIAYREAKRTIPPAAYRSFTDSNGVFSRRMVSSAAAFQGIMPFYVIKPLYVGLTYVFHKAGCSLMRAVFLPSVLSYFLIGLLTFYWLKRHLSALFAAIICSLLQLSGPLLEAASYATPDCVSALLLLAAFYALLEKRSMTGMYFFLLLAVLTRVDNVILACMLLAFAAFGQKLPSPVSRLKTLWMATGLVAAYFLATSLVTLYGWNLLYLPTFYKQHYETYYRDKTPSFLYDFVKQRHSAIMVAMKSYHLFIYLCFAVLLFLGTKSLRWKQLSFDQAFLAVLIATIGIRAAVYTDLGDRFLVAYFFVIVVLFVRRFKQNTFYASPVVV